MATSTNRFRSIARICSRAAAMTGVGSPSGRISSTAFRVGRSCNIGQYTRRHSPLGSGFFRSLATPTISTSYSAPVRLKVKRRPSALRSGKKVRATVALTTQTFGVRSLSRSVTPLPARSGMPIASKKPGPIINRSTYIFSCGIPVTPATVTVRRRSAPSVGGTSCAIPTARAPGSDRVRSHISFKSVPVCGPL